MFYTPLSLLTKMRSLFCNFHVDLKFALIVATSSKKQVEKRWIGDKRTVFLLILVGASILGNIASGVYWTLTNAKPSEPNGNGKQTNSQNSQTGKRQTFRLAACNKNMQNQFQLTAVQLNSGNSTWVTGAIGSIVPKFPKFKPRHKRIR